VVRSERGAAVLIALLLALLVAAVAAALVTLTTTETQLSASFRDAQQASYGADAALELGLHDLATIPDWSTVLAAPPANVTSSFDDRQATPRAPDGARLDLARLTAERQAESDARDGLFAADGPQWRLFAHGPAALLPGAPDLPLYLVVWVADDESDGDGDSTTDANGRILVWGAAFGARGGRRSVEARVARVGAGELRLLSRREVR